MASSKQNEMDESRAQAEIKTRAKAVEFSIIAERFATEDAQSARRDSIKGRRYVCHGFHDQHSSPVSGWLFTDDGGVTASGEIWAYNIPSGSLISVYAKDADWPSLKVSWDMLVAELRRLDFDPTPLAEGQDDGATEAIGVNSPLGKLEQAILSVFQDLHEQRAQITNRQIAGLLLDRGIYNLRTGEAYTDVHISRMRSRLKRQGYQV